jgi:TonB family protein
MSSHAVYEELDVAVSAMLRSRTNNVEPLDPTVNDLLTVADLLRDLPNAKFREHLRLELGREAAVLASASHSSKAALVAVPGRTSKREEEQILPTLFGEGYGSYPVHQSSFLASALLHAAMIAVILGSSLWIARHHQELKQQVISLVGISDYPLPISSKKAGGGGGGGDHDLLPASKGTAPRFAREQITPPAIVMRNENPKLAVEPTVVGPPDIKLPQSSTLGDPLAALLQPSNGPGSGGGIGNGTGGGVGPGTGPGVGPGHAGGYGGGAYRVGGGVSAPRVVYDPDPEYSEEARKAKYQGTVTLWLVVSAEGKPYDIRVQRSLGMGLDEKAIEAVKQWRFEPARKDGHPVPVMINVEVNFRLY